MATSDLASRIGGGKTKRGSFGLKNSGKGQRGGKTRPRSADSGYSAHSARQPSSSLGARLDSSRVSISSKNDIKKKGLGSNTRVSKPAPKSKKDDSLLRNRLAGQKSRDPGQLFDELIRADRSRSTESVEPGVGESDDTEPRNGLGGNFGRIKGASKKLTREKQVTTRSTSATNENGDNSISNNLGTEIEVKIRGAGAPRAVKISNLDRRTTVDDVLGTFRHLGFSEPLSLTVCPSHSDGQTSYNEATVIFRNLAEAERCVEGLAQAKSDTSGDQLEATIVPQRSMVKEAITTVPRKPTPFKANATNSNEDGVVYVKGRGFHP